MAGLLTIPPEIIFSILGCCDLSSIYALRRTCKDLHDLSHDRTVWIGHLNRICLEVDTPLAQFDLDNMSAREIEARATSKYRFAHTLRTSDSFGIKTHTHLSIRNVKSPSNASWRATSSSPGGRWMAAIVGASLQIWDTNFIGLSPPLLARLEVSGLDSDQPAWIYWYYSSEDYQVLVVLQTVGEFGAAHQFVIGFQIDDSRLPSLHLRGDLRTHDPTFLHLDKANPKGPLLAVNLANDQLHLWYPESAEMLLVHEQHILPAFDIVVCRGFIIRFGDDKTTITITRIPRKEELLNSTSVPLITTLNYRNELEGYYEHNFRLAGIQRSQVTFSRHPDQPLARFVVLCDFRPYDPQGWFTPDVVVFHKALFLDKIDGTPTFHLKTLSVYSASTFPTRNELPDRPLLELGNEWFLWWTIPHTMNRSHLRLVIYLLADPQAGKKDSGSFLMVGHRHFSAFRIRPYMLMCRSQSHVPRVILVKAHMWPRDYIYELIRHHLGHSQSYAAFGLMSYGKSSWG
ncbi:hypothetical protein DL96DRAFT_1821331 [Flagelloscypha sp. PMI_526]|nr:hypothetical protein DL96DRAFT_1821331 [Flagelloscypha sp. PMI_526]